MPSMETNFHLCTTYFVGCFYGVFRNILKYVDQFLLHWGSVGSTSIGLKFLSIDLDILLLAGLFKMEFIIIQPKPVFLPTFLLSFEATTTMPVTSVSDSHCYLYLHWSSTYITKYLLKRIRQPSIISHLIWLFLFSHLWIHSSLLDPGWQSEEHRSELRVHTCSEGRAPLVTDTCFY